MDGARNDSKAFDETEVFHMPNAGLSEVPILDISGFKQLKSLNLSSNGIEVIPQGIWARLTDLEVCNLSNNRIGGIPHDFSCLQRLQKLDLSYNLLTCLPQQLCEITTLVQLDISHNRVQVISGNIALWSNLKALNISYNDIEFLPADLGWIPLEQLHVEKNPRLRIPAVVQENGFTAVISYLQVVCEQHRLVEEHLDKFAHPDGASREPMPEAPDALQQYRARRLEEAAGSGILDLQGCATDEAVSVARALPAIYVADLRYSQRASITPDILSFEGLVVLNSSYNGITNVAEDVTPSSLGVLNLSFNKLRYLPAALGNAPVLQQMYLANNK